MERETRLHQQMSAPRKEKRHRKRSATGGPVSPRHRTQKEHKGGAKGVECDKGDNEKETAKDTEEKSPRSPHNVASEVLKISFPDEGVHSVDVKTGTTCAEVPRRLTVVFVKFFSCSVLYVATSARMPRRALISPYYYQVVSLLRRELKEGGGKAAGHPVRV